MTQQMNNPTKIRKIFNESNNMTWMKAFHELSFIELTMIIYRKIDF